MGELGNTMPLALANILSSPILIFTSLQTTPVLLISPSTMHNALPAVYLAFNQFGAGHYDAVISNDASTSIQAREPACSDVGETDSKAPRRKCYCGRKSNQDRTTKQACVDQKHYALRCPCYKNQLGCQDECSCKQCENPFGKRGATLNNPLAISPSTPRMRAKHSNDKIKFWRKVHENMETNIERFWTRSEVILFECVIQLLSSLQIAFSDENLKRYFNSIVRRICQLGYTTEFVEKSLDDIRSRIKAHDKALKAWLNGCYRKETD